MNLKMFEKLQEKIGLILVLIFYFVIFPCCFVLYLILSIIFRRNE